MANVFCLYYGLCLCWPHSRYMRCLCFASFSNCLNFFFFGLHFDYAVALFLRSPMESDRWANVVGISLVQLIISTRCVVNIFVGAVRSIVYPVCVVRVKPILFFFFSFLSLFSLLATDIFGFFFFFVNQIINPLDIEPFRFVLCVKCLLNDDFNGVKIRRRIKQKQRFKRKTSTICSILRNAEFSHFFIQKIIQLYRLCE